MRESSSKPHSSVAAFWKHLLHLARHDPEWFAPYVVLAALVTDDPTDRAAARRLFMRRVQSGPEALASVDAQFHTHTIAAPLGRWAIFYDWLCEIDLFTADEHARIRKHLLDHAQVFAAQQLAGRIRRFDNQVLSNAFGVASVGFVLGKRRGNSPLARQLLHTGTFWLLDMLRQLPADGWGTEGSTYQEHVILPVVLLSALLAETITSQPVMTHGVGPDGPPARRVLDTSMHLIGPTGLLPGWDDYGFQYATVKSAMVYLARLDRDPRPLALVRHLGLWPRHTLPAWEIDDRLWCLVWWPVDIDDSHTQPDFSPWILPSSAAALQCHQHRARLFQYWDQCGGVSDAGRANVDPNNITFEYQGSPILLDGHGSIPLAQNGIDPHAAIPYVGMRRIESVQEYLRGNFNTRIDPSQALARLLNGSVAQANALIFDDEAWYVPLEPRVGQGQALHHAGPLQAARSDAAAIYRDRYDVHAVTRTSLMIDGRYVLLCDRVESATPHRIAWQAFLRCQATMKDDRVIVRTPEQVQCDVIPLQAGDLRLECVEGFPRKPDGRSMRLRQHLPAQPQVRIDFALFAQSLLEPVADVSDSWERIIGTKRDRVRLDDPALLDPMIDGDAPRHYVRRLRLDPLPGSRCWLQITAAPADVQLFVNDQPVSPAAPQTRGIWHQSVCDWPWFFDIADALRRGDNEIRIVAKAFHGEVILGPIRLHRQIEPAAVEVHRLGESRLGVRCGSIRDDVIIENTSGPISWGESGQTDARQAVLRADGSLAAADVTRIDLPRGLTLTSQAPCDVAWSPARTCITRYVAGTRVDLGWTGGELHVEAAGCLYVHYAGTAAHTLTLRVDQPAMILINGLELAESEPRRNGMVEVTLPATPAASPTPAEPASVDHALELERTAGPHAISALILGLHSDQWMVQVACADALGRLSAHDAVPDLLKVLEAEEAGGPYPPLRTWWRQGRMLFDARVDGIDADLERPRGEKRWRLKRAVVTALGKIGDPRAVAPLHQMMNRGDDYFIVMSQVAVALGRLGSADSLPVLERHRDAADPNTRVHARLAIDLIQSRISRSEFEQRVGFA
jgi:hypothetical protein